MRLTLRFFAALVTFAVGLALVWTINYAYSNFEARYPIPKPPPVPVIKPEFPEPQPIMDYQPLHWPRLKNARLALPGETLSEDPATKGFEDWTGIYFTKKGFILGKAKVKISAYSDEMVDGPGQKTGRRYSVRGQYDNPVAVLKGIPGINEKVKMQTVFSVLEDDYWDDELRLGEGITQLPLFKGTKNEFYPLGETLIFSDGHKRQIVHDFNIKEETDHLNYGFPTLLWAGDIDGDNKLDFMLRFLDQGEGSSSQRLVLYISSQAAPTELVAPVAGFYFYTVC